MASGLCGGSRLGRGELAFDRAELAVAVEHELDRRRRDRGRLLRDVRDRPRRRKLDLAGILMQLAPNEREEARFAAAVRSDEADLVPGVDRQVRAVEQPLRAAGEDEVGETQHSYGQRIPDQRSV